MVSREPDREDLLEDIPSIVTVYAQSAALLTADFYTALDPNNSFYAKPVDVLSEERVRDTADWVFQGPQSPHHRLKMAMHSLVFDAARDTVTANALEENVLVAREEENEACGECKQRASLVPAATDQVEWERHQGCEFLFVPARKGRWNAPEHLQEWSAQIDEARLAGNVNAEDIARWLDRH